MSGRALILTALAFALTGCAGEGPSHDRDAATPSELSLKVDHFGYRPGDLKVAVLSADPGPNLLVRRASGAVAFRIPLDGGSILGKGSDPLSGDSIWWVDLSPLEAPGSYRIESESRGARSYEFVIAKDAYAAVLRAATRTFYLQRCGTGKLAAYAGEWADDAPCHRTDTATGPAPGQADRGRLDLSGGWHDAGDYNKYVSNAVSSALLYMLLAFESDPDAFPDGSLGIPESGNGISDLLDEARWELDFLLKMQLPDGAVLSEVHVDGSANGAAPPSADTGRRYYQDPTLESGAVLAGSCALAARVFAAAGQTAYAATLKKAALLSWRWLERQGSRPEKAWAAAEIWRLEPATLSARAFVDAYHPAQWSNVSFAVTSYDTYAAFTYLLAPGATPKVAAQMRANIATEVDRIFASDDLYRNGMPKGSYFWGSNSIRAAHGVFLLRAARLDATGSHTPTDCRRHALDFLHYFHGQNPLSMVYLTNMAALGGEHSSWQIFHNWFGQSGSPYSRARYLGRAASVAEPHYPYFAGTDNHGIADDQTSLFGPAPGFVPGGPNKDYSGDARPPRGVVHPNRAYRDWCDQKVWTARTWEITESSIAYQGPYIALVAAFASANNEATKHGRAP